MCENHTPEDTDEILEELNCYVSSNKSKLEQFQLEGKCPNSLCSWKGAINILPEHYIDCEWRVNRCKFGFVEKLQLKICEKHEQENCKLRLIECSMCEEKIMFTLLANHLRNDCPDFKIECKNKCGSVFLRRDLSNH